jgi:hypothetical protein
MTLAGMGWLSRVQLDSGYLTAVALPMMLIGAGQGLAFAPLTSAGLIGVRADQAGAASGVINTFHQLGMALGLSVLVAASAGAGSGSAASTAAGALVAEVDTALTVAAGWLALCLVAVLTLIAPPVRPATVAGASAPVREPAVA